MLPATSQTCVPRAPSRHQGANPSSKNAKLSVNKIGVIGMKQPSLETTRVILRPLHADDAARIQSLVNHPAIADMTAQIPYPYPQGLAASWISTQTNNWAKGTGVVYGVVLKEENTLIGVVSVQKLNTGLPELGYWLGTEYWGKGYATEAARCLCEFAFRRLDTMCIFACHLTRNSSSGNVLKKLGFCCLGSTEERVKKSQKIEMISNYILKIDSLKGAHPLRF